MKKRTLALLLVLALVLTSVIALVACNPEEETPTTKTYKVSFWDGNQKLGEVDIEEGKTVDLSKINYDKKDGYTFVGWYDDITCEGDALDVAKLQIKADTKLFGNWQSNTVEADDRMWYIIGNYDGTNSQWDFPTVQDEDGEWTIVEGKESRILTQEDGANVYKLSVELRPNMKFRFATNLINPDWTGDETTAEVGMGNFVGVEYAAGTNPEKDVQVTLEDHKYAVVKNSDGEVVFHGGDEHENSWIHWNIWLAEGQDGIYEFTIKTYPGEDTRNTLEWKCTEKLAALDRTCKMVLAGTMNSWKASEDNGYLMSEMNVDGKGEGTYKYALTIDTIGTTPEGAEQAIANVEFKVVNIVSNMWWGPLEGGKVGDTGMGPGFIVEENGTYVIIVDTVNKTYKFEKAAIRVTGTIDGNGWADGTAQRSEGYKDNMYVMNKVESETEGVEKYELVLEITADHAASWLSGKAAAIKVELCGAGEAVWGRGVGENVDANIEIDTIGWYKVTLELSYNEAGEPQTTVSIATTSAPEAAE